MLPNDLGQETTEKLQKDSRFMRKAMKRSTSIFHDVFSSKLSITVQRYGQIIANIKSSFSKLFKKLKIMSFFNQKLFCN